MEQEKLEYLQDLQSIADSEFDRIRDGAHLSFLELPSFTPRSLWTIDQPKSGEESVVVKHYSWGIDFEEDFIRDQIAWLRVKMKKLKEIHLRTQQTTIKTSWLKHFLKRLEKEKICLHLSEATIGCDGTSYEFNWNSSFYKTRIHWWCEAPEQWDGATSVIREFMDSLNNLKYENPANQALQATSARTRRLS